ncbi:MAG TPA: hypothetical protein VGG94_01150 [Chthoniobacterales bacterium]
MRERVRRVRRLSRIFLFLSSAIMVVSCASEKPPLVDDPDTKHEGLMPWNKQEKWETSGGQLSGITDHR